MSGVYEPMNVAGETPRVSAMEVDGTYEPMNPMNQRSGHSSHAINDEQAVADQSCTPFYSVVI